MNIQQYRRFQTRRQCRDMQEDWAYVDELEADTAGVACVRVTAMLDDQWYSAYGYAWRNSNDANDSAMGYKIARGRALKALADIIWQADTAHAMHKAQAAREAEQAVVLVRFDEFVARYGTDTPLTMKMFCRGIVRLRDSLRKEEP